MFVRISAAKLPYVVNAEEMRSLVGEVAKSDERRVGSHYVALTIVSDGTQSRIVIY